MKPSTAWLEMAMWKLWLWHKKIMNKNRYLLLCVFCVCLFPLLIISIGVSKKISNIGFNTETKFFKFLIWIFFLLVCFCLVFSHAVCFLMDVVVWGSYEARMDDAVQGNTHAACRWRRFMEKVSKRHRQHLFFFFWTFPFFVSNKSLLILASWNSCGLFAVPEIKRAVQQISALSKSLQHQREK